MPDATVQAIAETLKKQSPALTLSGRTYAEGSSAVLAASLWFALQFEQLCVETYREYD